MRVSSSNKKASRSGLEWPIGIAIVLTAFLTFLIGALVVLSGEHFDLVTKDYYEKGLEYQHRIDAIKNAQAIPNALVVQVDPANQMLIFRFAPEFEGKKVEGTIYLYRPSDATQDKYIQLPSVLSGNFGVPIDRLAPGKWRVKTQWQIDGKSYYSESIIFIE